MTGHARALRLLAREYGVLPSRREAAGSRRRADEETLVALLRSMGAPLDRIEDAEPALRQRRAARAGRIVEPVLVLWDGAPARIDLHLPATMADAPFTITVEREGREPVAFDRSRCRVSAARRDVPGFVAMIVDVPVPFAFGVHAIVVDVGGRRGRATVIAAPGRVPEPGVGDQRRWGVVAPALAPRRGRALLPGDTAGLRQLADWLGPIGGRVVGTAELAARFHGVGAEPRGGERWPVSRRFWDERLVALDDLEELHDAPYPAPDTESLPGDHDPHRRRLARAARLVEERPERARALREWVAADPTVLRYAAFRAAVERDGAGARVPRPDLDDDLVHRHAYAQWVAEQQLGSLRAHLGANRQALLGRLPAGVDPRGFDASDQPDLFVAGARVELPPEPVAGDDPTRPHGFPPLDPHASREQGHRYFAECLDAHFRHLDVLVVEQVEGLHRQWWVPAGADPVDGAYVQYPSGELYALVCLAAWRHGALVVGEGGARLPHEAGRSMQQHRLFGMYDAAHHLAPGGEMLPAPARRTIATTGSPSAPWGTFLEAWHALRPDRRGALLELLRGAELLAATYGDAPDAADVLGALVELLGTSRAELVVLPLDDLLPARDARATGAGAAHRHGDPSPDAAARVGPADLEAAKPLLARLDEARRPGYRQEVGVSGTGVDQPT